MRGSADPSTTPASDRTLLWPLVPLLRVRAARWARDLADAASIILAGLVSEAGASADSAIEALADSVGAASVAVLAAGRAVGVLDGVGEVGAGGLDLAGAGQDGDGASAGRMPGIPTGITRSGTGVAILITTTAILTTITAQAWKARRTTIPLTRLPMRAPGLMALATDSAVRLLARGNHR